MTISVLIPVYNHAAELVACIQSLQHQTCAPMEVIVVDDGSTDAPEAALEAAGLRDHVRWISLGRNQGAPVARNTGFAASAGEVVIFLDADAVLRPDALAMLRDAVLADPTAAFAYSAFAFGGKTFRSQPFSVEALAQGNYIHTSALIRRGAFVGFDPALTKFQDWDLWIRIAQQGGRGVYVPELLMQMKERSQGGMSRWLPAFAYRLPWAWIGWKPEPVQRYERARDVLFAKHKEWRRAALEKTSPSVISTRAWLAVILSFALLSASVIGTPLGGAAAVCVALAVGIAAIVDPRLALGWMACELLIGSKGGFLKWGSDVVNDGGLGIRVLQFAAFFVGFAIWAVRVQAWKRLRLSAMYRMGAPLLPLVVFAAWGVVRGWLLGQPFLLADANAWVFWLLFVPCALLCFLDDSSARLRAVLKPAITAGVGALTMATLGAFVLFSHALPVEMRDAVYTWIRQSGLGEVTRAGGSVHRIFFQSQIFLVFAWLWYWSRTWKDALPLSWRTWLGWTALSAAILASLSRSFWVGLVAAGGMGLLFALLYGMPRRSLGSWLVRPIVSGIGGMALLAALVFLPLFPGGAGLGSALGGRFSGGEAAASSRSALLPVLREGIAEHPWLGSGFGATLTYPSSDPRIVQKTGGMYTTYAFEWGWLDVWYKLGIAGLLALVWVMAWIGSRAFSLPERDRVWVWTSLVALASIHVFTPYLNHPLGIGTLIYLWICTEAS